MSLPIGDLKKCVWAADAKSVYSSSEIMDEYRISSVHYRVQAYVLGNLRLVHLSDRLPPPAMQAIKEQIDSVFYIEKSARGYRPEMCGERYIEYVYNPKPLGMFKSLALESIEFEVHQNPARCDYAEKPTYTLIVRAAQPTAGDDNSWRAALAALAERVEALEKALRERGSLGPTTSSTPSSSSSASMSSPVSLSSTPLRLK